MAIKSPATVDRVDSHKTTSNSTTQNQTESIEDDSTKEPIDLDDVKFSKYEEALKNVPNKRIKYFARKLKIREHYIDDIFFEEGNNTDEIRHRILKKWIEGDEATDASFAEALRSLGLNCEADDIFTENTECRTPRRQNSKMPTPQPRDRKVSAQTSMTESDLDSCTSSQNGWAVSKFICGGAVLVCAVAVQLTMDMEGKYLLALYGTVLIIFFLLYRFSNTGTPPSLRRPSSLFTGKAHNQCLRNISKHLAKHRNAAETKQKVFIEVLYGLGGCGKTEIMCSYVWNNWKRYKGGVYNLDGKSNSCLDYGFMQILKKMKSDIRQEDRSPTAIRRSVLQELGGKKDWLLVIDDADDPDIIQQVLIHIEDLNEGHILITSRAERGWLDQFKPTMTHVQHFSEEDSAIYLLRQTRSTRGKLMSFKEAVRELEKLKSDDRKEYSALMWLCGEKGLHGLPLALKQASKYVCQHNLKFKEYKRTYLHHQAEVVHSIRSDPLVWWLKSHDLKSDNVKILQDIAGTNITMLKDLSTEHRKEIRNRMTPEDAQELQNAINATSYSEFAKMAVLSRENVVTTWKMNYESLTKEEHVKEFLHLCSCLATRISVALLADGAQHLNEGSLKNHLKSSRTLSMSPEKQICRRINELFVKLTEYSFTTIVGQSTTSSSTGKKDSEQTIHHLLQQVMFVHFLNLKEKTQSLNNAITILENLFPKDVLVTGSASTAVHERHSTIALHTLAVCQQIRTLKEDEIGGLKNTSPLFRSSSNYFLRLGRAEDAKLLCKVMKELSGLREPINKTEFAKDLCYLGRAYFDLKLLDKAEKCFQQSIKLLEEDQKEGSIHMLMAKQKLGRVKQNNTRYMEDAQESKKIENFLQDNLRQLREVCEKSKNYHYATASALHQLGRFYQDKCNYKEAQKHLEEALEVRKKYAQQYSDEENVAIGMVNLARNHILKGEYNNDEVEKLLTRLWRSKANLRLQVMNLTK
ncbi:uncharacterized protein [Ptychodera flava]|uniref:uncharacterized protein n=1 Tax=Ptychodera flava TaxID=63121 RepID=UPI00396A2540